MEDTQPLGKARRRPATDTDTRQEKSSPSTRINKWWVLIAVGLSTFMSAVDISVVNMILPSVRTSLASGYDAVQWVGTVYLLVLSGLLLSFGRLGDLRGHRGVYLWGFVVFVAASALCGMATSAAALIVFRAVQALGSAMFSSNSPAILTKSFPSAQRGQALGLQATMTYLGLTAGPSLGGLLTDSFGWRSVFYINLPVGLLALLIGLRFVPHDRPHSSVERFDLAGALLFMGGLVTLLFGLNQAHRLGWTSPTLLGLLALAAALLALFVRRELRVPAPMLDLSLFKRRLFSFTVITAVLNYICVYSILFLMPFFLVEGQGLSNSRAGLLLSAMPLAMAIVAPLSGTISDRLGPRLPATLGMAGVAAGLLLLAQLGPQASAAHVVLALAVAGIGIGVFISPNNSALMGSAPRRRQGIAAGILATARNVGMALGIGLAGAIFTTVLSNQAGSALATFDGVHISLYFAAAVAVIGIFTSAIRGELDPQLAG